MPATDEGDAPVASAPFVATAIRALRQARIGLAARRRSDVLGVVADVIDDWLAVDSPWLVRAVATLPAATGFSPAMIRFALPAMLEPLRTAQLEPLLDAESNARGGPPLILHVLPGNLPGLAAIPAVLSLVIGSAALLKPGRGDRAFPALFIESLAARDADLAAALAAVYWPGGDRACETLALDAADLVIASGDDASIADLARRASGRFIGHGHRVSFAVVTAETVGDARAVADLALDVATWDQRGCLSPQLCFVEGDFDVACDFGARLAAELTTQAAALPAAVMPVGDRLAVRRWRDEAEWASFDGERYRLFAAADEADGTVVVEPTAVFRPTPLWRSIRVLPLTQWSDLPALLAPLRGVLEGAGLAAPPGRWGECAAQLSAAGVHLVSRLGAMQRPPLAWRQGGRARLADWCIGDTRAA
ncbi:MAG: acyl-CoA reductase [bacterium]